MLTQMLTNYLIDIVQITWKSYTLWNMLRREFKKDGAQSKLREW